MKETAEYEKEKEKSNASQLSPVGRGEEVTLCLDLFSKAQALATSLTDSPKITLFVLYISRCKWARVSLNTCIGVDWLQVQERLKTNERTTESTIKREFY